MKTSNNYNIMKSSFKTIASLLLLFAATVTTASATVPPADTIRILTTGSLSPLVKKWTGEYTTVNKGPAFVVEERNSDKLFTGRNLMFLTDELTSEPVYEKSWKLVVAHNALVAVTSSANPNINELSSTGISPEMLSAMLSRDGQAKWSDICKSADKTPVNVILADGKEAIHRLEAFARKTLETNASVRIVSGDEFIKTVASNRNSIGFCYLNDILDENAALQGGIAFVPVDRNGNGKIDSFEKIYDDPSSLLRGVWTGKYPHTLSGSIYAVSATKPASEEMLSFLRWIVSGNDKIINGAGFSQIAGSEKESGLASIGVPVSLPVKEAERSVNYSWILLFAGIILTAGIIAALLRSRNRKRKPVPVSHERKQAAFRETSIAAPAGLYFDKSHTWAFMERDGLVRIGLNDFMQHVTGDITDVRLLETGTIVRRGEKIITIIREGKQLNLYAPVSGTIMALNTDLYLDSSIINSSPYDDGWVYLVEPRNWQKEIQMMFSRERFSEWLRGEFIRLKDFIAETLKSHYPAYSTVPLQDGGELIDNPLEKMGPEIWEDFQTIFIDKSR